MFTNILLLWEHPALSSNQFQYYPKETNGSLVLWCCVGNILILICSGIFSFWTMRSNLSSFIFFLFIYFRVLLFFYIHPYGRWSLTLLIENSWFIARQTGLIYCQFFLIRCYTVWVLFVVWLHLQSVYTSRVRGVQRETIYKRITISDYTIKYSVLFLFTLHWHKAK